jgi:hypothetical protein
MLDPDPASSADKDFSSLRSELTRTLPVRLLGRGAGWQVVEKAYLSRPFKNAQMQGARYCEE